MRVCEFEYSLPSELIAQYPPSQRHESRLMIVFKKSGKIVHSTFWELDNFIDSHYLLVVNNTKVFPARLSGTKLNAGKVEILLIRKIKGNLWEAMLKPFSRTKKGAWVKIDGSDCFVVVRDEISPGKKVIDFLDNDPLETAHKFGVMPLPPYIKRKNAGNSETMLDKQRYQSLFAHEQGSVAAPTASLHFSAPLIDKLKEKNIEFADITLHVGPGTFMPVKTDDVEMHSMESECFSINEDSARKINSYLSTGKKILPVGTTTVRALESCVGEGGFVLPRTGETNLFIYPGRNFRLVDSMITNFHLPKSTLLMLVCALAGKDLIMKAYEIAIKEKYRFYSYGDAMLILDR